MNRTLTALGLAAALLSAAAAPAAAALTSPTLSIKDPLGAPTTVLNSADRVQFSFTVNNTAAGAGSIVFTFAVTDPDGKTVFTQTGNSAPASVTGIVGAALNGLPVARFFDKAGQYTLTGTATLGAASASASKTFQVRDPKIIMILPADYDMAVSASPLRFQWETAAPKYRLKVAEDTAFARLKINQVVTGATLVDIIQDAETRPQDRLGAGILYYWTVEGLDNAGNVIARPDTFRTFKIKAGFLPQSRDVAVTKVIPSFRTDGQLHEITAKVTVANLGAQQEGPFDVSASINGTPLNALGFQGFAARVDMLSPKGEAQLAFRSWIDLAAVGLKRPYMVTAIVSHSDDDSSDNMKTVELKLPVEETGACSPNPCHNGGVCVEAVPAAVCSCRTGFSGVRCELVSATPGLPTADGLGITRVERQPVPREWVENPNAAGAYAPVKVTLANNLGASAGPVRLTLKPVAGTPANPPSETVESIGPGQSRDVILNLPFREPSGSAGADYVASWDVSGDGAHSGFKTVSLDIPRRRAPAAGAVPGLDLELSYAGQEDADAGADFVPVKVVARNLGRVATPATIRIKGLADEEKLAADLPIKSLGVGQGADSFNGTFLVPKAKLGAGDLEAVVSIEGSGTEAGSENNFKRVTLRAPAASSDAKENFSAECDDHNSCTYDIMTYGACSHPTKPNGTACSSGNEDMMGETCFTGVCGQGRPREKAPVAPTWNMTGAAAAAGAQSQDVTVDVSLKSGNAEGVYRAQLQLWSYNAKSKSFTPERTFTPRFSEPLDLSGGKKAWKIAFRGIPTPKNDGISRQWRAYLQPHLNGAAQNQVARSVIPVVSPAAKTETAAPACGNGVVEAGEMCDVSTVGCTNCQVDPGYVCSAAGCKRFAGAAVAAAGVKEGPDLQVALKNFSVKPAGGKFALSADVTVLDKGDAPAGRYELKYAITTAKAPVEDKRTVTDRPLAAGGSSSLGPQTLFAALDRDPIKEAYTLTATVTLLGDNGRPVKDANPSNDTFTLALGGPAAAGSPPDLLVEVKNPKVVREADKSLTLKADVAVKNAGGSPAPRYSLRYVITTAGALRTDAPHESDAPLAANEAASQAGRTIFSKLTRDPIASGDVLTATVIMEDDQGQTVKDANPDNDVFTLKLVGEPAPPLPRDISVKNIVIGESASGGVPVTVTVVNDGPKKEPKISVRLVPTSGYPADALKSQDIADLGPNGTTGSVKFTLPLLEAPAAVKFHAELSVDPKDPVLTNLVSEEKTLELPAPWFGGMQLPDLSKYFSVTFKPRDGNADEGWGLLGNETFQAKVTALTAALGNDMKYAVEVGAIYGGPAPIKGSYKFVVKGMGDPNTLKGLEEPQMSQWIDTSAQQPWKETLKFNLPKTDDQEVLFHFALVDSDGKEIIADEKTAKVPGLKSEFFRKVMPEKHDLKISDFGIGKGSIEVGGPEDGPMTVHAKIKAAGTVKEDRASITFEVDGSEVRTLGLPGLNAGGESDFTFHLPWREGKKLKATVDVGETADNPDSKDIAPGDNAAEMDMPKRDLAVTEIGPDFGFRKKAYFSQTEQKWPAYVEVKNLGDMAEEVEPPIVMVEGQLVKPVNGYTASIPAGSSSRWKFFVQPDAKNLAAVGAMIQVADGDAKNNRKIAVLKFPPKPPRLDLAVLSATVRPEKMDYGALTVPIEIVVKNLGGGESLPLRVGVGRAKPQSFPKLKAGAELKVTLDHPLDADSQNVQAWVSPDVQLIDDGVDADESNNSKPVMVPRLPWDLSVGDVTLGTTIDNEKRTIPVVVTVNNAGKTTVKAAQVSVTLGAAEYVSDPSNKPDIDAGKSKNIVVNVPLPAAGGPAKATVQTLGSLDGELNPADNKKEVVLQMPDRPLWNLAVTKVVAADTAWRNLSFPGFFVTVTVSNTGVLTEDGPTVSLTRKKNADGFPPGTAPDEELGRKTVPGKLKPGETNDLIFVVPNTYKGDSGAYDLSAALVDNKDDKPEDDQLAVETIFSPRDLSISGLEIGQDMIMVDKGIVRIPVTVHVSKNSFPFDDTIYDITLSAGGKEQTKKITDGSLSADFTIDARWGESVTATAKVTSDRDANPGNNTDTKTLNIPNPPVTIGSVRVHDNTPGSNCFFVFPEFAAGFTALGYRMSLEGSGVAKFEGDLERAGWQGWPAKAHLYPSGLTSMGPWDFTLKMWRDGKVVFEQGVSVPAKPYNTALPPPTPENRAIAAKRNYKVASISAPTADELAAVYAKGQRDAVPVKIALQKEWGDPYTGAISVRVRENGKSLGPDIPVTMGADGQGSATVDVSLPKTPTARSLTAMIVDFEDANPKDDTLTTTLNNFPARPVFDTAITALELGELKDGKSAVKVTVTNLGDRAEKNIPVRVYVAGDSVAQDKTVASLDPKKSVVVDFQMTPPMDGKVHTAIAKLVDLNDDNTGNNEMSGKWKLGWDYKVGTPQVQTEEITGKTARFTVQIDRVSGNYPLDEMKLKINKTDDTPPWAAVAKRTASGSFVGTFEVPLLKDSTWTGGVGATLVDYDDDNPADNSGAVNLTLPWVPRSELSAGALVLTRKGSYYEAKLPINSQSDITEKNVKVGLRMDGHIIDPDAVIPSIARGGSDSSRMFRIPAHTPGKYEIKAGVLDRPDLAPDNNMSILVLTVTPDPNYKEPSPPTTLISGTLSPAAPRPGADFKLTCKDLPEGTQFSSQLINKNPNPYQLNSPGYQIKSSERTIDAGLGGGGGGFELGSTSKFDLAMGAFTGGLTAAAKGGNVGDILKGAAKGTAATALGKTASGAVGLDSPNIGTDDKALIALGALTGGVKALVQGKGIGGIAKGAASGAAQTALGDDVSDTIGLDTDSDVSNLTDLAGKMKDADDLDAATQVGKQADKDEEPSDTVDEGPDNVTFALNKDTPPGSYVMRIWITGKEDTACEAPFTIH